jgi:peptidoglycan/LPS O-acetylase OafA/YrhL
MFSVMRQKKTYIYILLCLISAGAAMIVSVPDNPPGILLSFLSSLFLVLAFTHNYTKAKSYLILTLVSLIGFFLAAVLHNVFEEMDKATSFEVIAVVFFLIAIFICPAGVIVGIAGSITKLFGKEADQIHKE